MKNELYLDAAIVVREMFDECGGEMALHSFITFCRLFSRYKDFDMNSFHKECFPKSTTVIEHEVKTQPRLDNDWMNQLIRLYHKYSRFAFKRSISKTRERILRWGLTLHEGDLINDCSGFNVKIREINVLCIFNKRGGYYIYDIEFITEPFGGGCSLVHCGVTNPIPRDILEKDYLEYHIKWLNHPDDWGNKELIQKRVNALNNGLHILDEDGILFQEYRQ